MALSSPCSSFESALVLSFSIRFEILSLFAARSSIRDRTSFLSSTRKTCMDFSNDSWTTRALLSGLDRRSIHSAVTRNICGKTEPSEQKAEANRPVVIVDSAFWQRRQLLAHMACQLGFAVTRTDG